MQKMEINSNICRLCVKEIGKIPIVNENKNSVYQIDERIMFCARIMVKISNEFYQHQRENV